MTRSIAAATLGALLSLTTAVAASAQGAPATSAPAVPTDAEVRQAMGAVERAASYREILAATERYQSVLASDRTVELADAYLRGTSLNETQRALVTLERQLSIDCSRVGATVAAQLLSIRIVSGSALLANTPEQFAGVLERFPELASAMTVDLVHDALAMPGASWPPALLPLVEQLASDWPRYGALEAARRMADASQAPASSSGTTPPQTTAPTAGPTLPGHWRNTRIVFERPVDTHLVLNADGSAETWIVRASGRDPSTRGRWRAQGTTLVVDWEDGSQRNQPYTFYEGQLVLPNTQGQRQFWELVR